MEHVISILEELIEAKRRGITISINGVCPQWNQPEDILMVLEEASYMKDFIGDEEGKIIHICYDRIQLN